MKIKFRALKDDMSDCRYVYGNLIYGGLFPRIQEDNNVFSFTTCIKGTEAMFTGILDKNNQEIYSDDTLYDEAVSLSCIEEESQPNGYRWEEPVEFVEGCFTVAMYPLSDVRMDMEICTRRYINGSSVCLR
jgi:hypothetical protein